MPVYISTEMMESKPAKGWWNLISEARMTAVVKYDPATMVTLSGLETLRRWARTGYCDRASGQYTSIFKLHMWYVGATYLAQLESKQCAALNFYSEALWQQLQASDELAALRAKYTLLNAAADNHRECNLTLHETTALAGDTMHFEFSGQRSVGRVSLIQRAWGKPVRQYAKSFIKQIGHPLTKAQLAAFMRNIEQPLTLQLQIEDDYPTRNSAYISHTTTTRLIR